MTADPYNLDSTDFATQLRNSFEDDAPKELPHPLLQDSDLAFLCDYIEKCGQELLQHRKPNGEMSDDAYFRFEEGLVLRPEIAMRLCIDYIRKRPELLAN